MNYTTQILEGAQIYGSRYPYQDTSYTSGSPGSETGSSDRSCRHKKLVNQEDYDTCFHCGAYVSKNGSKSLKGKDMNYQAFFPPQTIYETMTRRFEKFKKSLNPEYAKLRQGYVEWLLDLADKLRISNNSAHLGVILLDCVMFKDSSLISKLQLYAAVCLLVAAKTIELDERIPFLPKLKRYANCVFSTDDFRRAELRVLDLVEWNPQYSSALEINEFLMCQGVFFSSDEIEDSVNTKEKDTWSPEGLKENTQYENIPRYRNKDISKGVENTFSPDPKENNENSYSDASTNGTATDNVGTPINKNLGEDVSPSKPILPLFLKNNSTPANMESRSPAPKRRIPIEKKIGEILNHLETSYIKLSTLILKDIEFIEWEPKAVSAAIIAFFRFINRITPKWNSELEAITCLKFPQISACFDLIYKKFGSIFSANLPKIQSSLFNANTNKDNKAEPKFIKANSVYAQPKPDTNKINLVSGMYSKPATTVNPTINLAYVSDQKPFERKPNLNCQPKSSLPTSASSTSSYSYLKDDMKFKTKLTTGTINTEFPQRNQIKNQVLSTNGPSTRVNTNSGNYYSSNAGSAGLTRGSYLSGGSSGIPDSYLKNDIYSAKNTSGGISYQAKMGILKK